MSQTSKELEEFKEEIRSVLISTKDGLPLRKVDGDYYHFLGKHIPFRELGFSNEVELFYAIPDAVRVVNRGAERYLYSVCNEKTAHIVELVNKQKTNNTRFPHSKRSLDMYNVPQMQHSCDHNLTKVPPWMKKNIGELLTQYPDGLHVENLKCAYRTCFGTDINHQYFNFTNLTEFLTSLHNENVVTFCQNSDSSVVFPAKSLNNINNQSKKDISTSEGGPKNENENGFVSELVLQNLRKVMEHFRNGFPMTELCTNYRKVTGSFLNPADLSYNNVQELISDMDDIFHVEINKAGEWILLNARLHPEPEVPSKDSASRANQDKKTIPNCIRQNIYELLVHFSDGINLHQFEELYEMNFHTNVGWKELNYRSLQSMLLSLELNPPIHFVRCGMNDLTVILLPENTILQSAGDTLQSGDLDVTVPEDAVVLGEMYTPLKVPYEEDDWFPVQVATVESAGKIWLQFVSQMEQRNTELDDLMIELGAFYQTPTAGKYKIPERFLMKNLNCAVLYPEDQNWHRGCIIGKPGPTSYEVFYYDYGKIYVVHKELIRFLKKSFSLLPAQAFCARMARMQPFSTFYSPESSSRLLELSSSKPLMAQITSKMYMNTYSVILCDTSGNDDIFLNDVLVKEGLVQLGHDETDLKRLSEAIHLNKYGVYDSSSNLSPVLLASSINKICPPPGFNSTSAVINNPVMSPSISRNTNIATHICNPESLEQSNTGEEQEFERKNNPFNQKDKSCASKPPVELIDVSRTRVLEHDATINIISNNQGEKNRSNEKQTIQYNEYSDTQEASQVYVSSEEDEFEEPSEVRSSHASTLSINSSSQLRYCKKVCFREEYCVHLINFARQPFFSSGDVSAFTFGVDIIKRILQIKKYPPCHIIVSRENHPDLFNELEQSEVTGFRKDDAKADKVVLYTLSDVLEILTFLNYNKVTVVEDIEELLQNFNPDEIYWMTNENSVKACTHEGKIQRKLNDLKEERKSLLLAMLAEECSSCQNTKHLLEIHEEILELKAELSECSINLKVKSATEQAREFLDLVKVNSQTEKIPEFISFVESNSEPRTSVRESSEVELPTPAHPKEDSVLQSGNSDSYEARTATQGTLVVEPPTLAHPQIAGVQQSADSNSPEQITTVRRSSGSVIEHPILTHSQMAVLQQSLDSSSPEQITTVRGTSASVVELPTHPHTSSVLESTNLNSPKYRTAETSTLASLVEPSVPVPPRMTSVQEYVKSITVCNSTPLLSHHHNYMIMGPAVPRFANVMTSLHGTPVLPVTVQPIYPNNFGYLPNNVQYSPGINNFRFMTTPCNYNQWRT